MSCNLTVTYKRGAVGKVIEFNDLSDKDGLVDLTSFTVTLNVETEDGQTVIDDATVSQQDQSARQGDCYYTLDTDSANLATGIYRAELQLTNGSNVEYFPTNSDGDRTYITWIVQDHLG